MPTKRGAGGRQQNYDPRTGRFAKTNFALLFPPQPPTRKEKARKKEAQRRELLFHRAKNSRDPLVFDVFCAIEAELPGSVQFVNEYKFDPFLGKEREFDIITKKCIIEIKSGKKIKKGLSSAPWIVTKQYKRKNRSLQMEKPLFSGKTFSFLHKICFFEGRIFYLFKTVVF